LTLLKPTSGSFRKEGGNLAMIFAEINGRVNVEEDILTSSAIGLLSLLPDEEFINFIGLAKTLEGELFKDHYRNYTRITAIKFWSTDFPLGIPDVFIKLESNNTSRSAVLVIEVKHRSGKSGSAEEDEEGMIKNQEVDQLNRYWESLVQLYPQSDKAVVFLTGHRVMPRKDLETSLKASEGKANLFWLSWYNLYAFVFETLSSGKYPVESTEYKILQLLESYLQFKGYMPFSGWPQPLVPTNGNYCLPEYQRVYLWEVENIDTYCLSGYQRVYLWELENMDISKVVFYHGSVEQNC